jgi:hypothetical protein
MLMIAIALCAVLLTPAVWMSRQARQQRLFAQLARDEAIRARYLAQAALNAAKLVPTKQVKTGNLWAALTVNHSTFQQGQTKDLRIEFSLVNDGDKVILPNIAGSRIVIDGKELADPGSVFGNVPKDVRIKPLAPGESPKFGLLLDEHFKEPGTYRISWKGAGFQSSEMVLRILPQKAR